MVVFLVVINLQVIITYSKFLSLIFRKYIETLIL